MMRSISPSLFLFLFLTFFVSIICLSGAEEEPRYLTFSVKDRYGIYVRDLELDEVTLNLDGEPVEIRFLGGGEVDTAFAFFLENSPRTAMYLVSRPSIGQVNPIDRIRYEMMFGFFQPLTSIGRVMLAQFFDEIEVLQDFTDIEEYLVSSVNSMELNSVGILTDQIKVGRVLGRGVDLLRERPERRKVLVLFTTTIDRESYQNLEEYKEMLRETDIDLFVISYAIKNPTGTAYSFEEKMNRYFFRKLVAETGGSVFITGEFVYIDELFTELNARLRHSYTIGFYATSGEEVEEHEVEIKVDREKAEVYHREYLVF